MTGLFWANKVTPRSLTGMMLRITRFGFITPIDAIPTPDLAVPYAAMAFKKIDRHAAANVRGAGYIMTAAREQRTHLLQYSQTPGPL